MKTIFVKHFVEKEGNPKQNGWYFVYYSGIGTWAEFKNNKWIFGDERNLKDYDITKYVTHWLEEIEMLNDEQILNQFPHSKNENEKKAMYNRRKGAKWFRDKFFK